MRALIAGLLALVLLAAGPLRAAAAPTATPSPVAAPSPTPAGSPMTALFYQPQSRDRAVGEADWRWIFAEARRLGFDTLVLQWTRHGTAFADGDERDWLVARIDQARAAELDLVIGLASDPAFFERTAQTGEALDSYLRRLAIDDVDLARRWSRTLPADAIKGWYLTGEIDDVHWRDARRLDQLSHFVATVVTDLQSVLARPVYLSSFFTGGMEPQRYAALIERLGQTGARVWVQDGRGTGVLTEAEARLYLAPLVDCQGGRIDALIRELFVVSSDRDGEFRAHGIGPARTRALLEAPTPCAGRRVFFSLRYLPGIDRLMGTPIVPSPGEVPR